MIIAMPKMTSEEIDKLEAGREMDALVAEEVMEWRWEWSEEYPNVGCWMPSGYGERAWSPSTSISVAWEVVEKLKGLNFAVAIEDVSVPTTNWWVCFADNSEDKESHDEAPTAPLAISRAALKAKLL